MKIDVDLLFAGLRSLVLVALVALLAAPPVHAAAGIRGNGHMMMLEKNNLEIAALLRGWIAKNIR